VTVYELSNINLCFNFKQLYDNLKEEFFNNPGAMDVPSWADDVVMKRALKPKL
jgi:hypothetical protein